MWQHSQDLFTEIGLGIPVKRKKKKIKAYLAYDSWNANLNKLLERYNKVK